MTRLCVLALLLLIGCSSTSHKSNWKSVKASSFADPADIARFKKLKRRGYSDRRAFKYGDNGIGAWGDRTTKDIPMVALPRDDWRHLEDPRFRPVLVKANHRVIRALLADTMPWKKHIKNGAGLDLNPMACKQLGLRPPIMVRAEWKWHSLTSL
jgi:hypothetical protein